MKPLPPLHLAMIIVSGLLLVLCLLLHFQKPDDATFISMITLTAGFLFGKFTNGFKVADKEKSE